MSIWDSLIGAVQSYFNPKPSSNYAPWSQIAPSINNQSVNLAPPKMSSTTVPAGQGYVAPAKPKGVNVQGPTYSAPSISSGGGNSGSPSGGSSGGLPTQSNMPPPYIPPPSLELPVKSSTSLPGFNLSPSQQGSSATLTPAATNYANKKALQLQTAPAQTIIGDIGKAGTAATTALGNLQIGGMNIGQLPRWGTDNQAIFENLQNIGGQPKVDWSNLVNWFQNIVPRISSQIQGSPYFSQYNPTGTGSPAAPAPGPVPTTTPSKGQILPSAAQTGPSMAQGQGIIPSPISQSRTGLPTVGKVSGTPSPALLSTSNLPQNIRNIDFSKIPTSLSQTITPEAVQSIGELLLRSLLTNQSSLTGLSPGLAQALWGAPTAYSPFGGYNDTMAGVPNQTRIQQPANIPPVPQALARG